VVMVDVPYHFIRELINNGTIIISFVKTLKMMQTSTQRILVVICSINTHQDTCKRLSLRMRTLRNREGDKMYSTIMWLVTVVLK
jgi:hypothetical protein